MNPVTGFGLDPKSDFIPSFNLFLGERHDHKLLTVWQQTSANNTAVVTSLWATSSYLVQRRPKPNTLGTARVSQARHSSWASVELTAHPPRLPPPSQTKTCLCLLFCFGADKCSMIHHDKLLWSLMADRSSSSSNSSVEVWSSSIISLFLPLEKKKYTRQHRVSVATSRPIGALRHLTSQPITMDDWWSQRPMDCIPDWPTNWPQTKTLLAHPKQLLLFFFGTQRSQWPWKHLVFLHWQHLKGAHLK